MNRDKEAKQLHPEKEKDWEKFTSDGKDVKEMKDAKGSIGSLLRDKDAKTGKECSNAIKEGWLTKQGNYIKNWRPRWFQLIDGILYYYKEPTVEPKPTNYFVLAGSRVNINDRMRANCFELILPNGDRRYMSASSKEERDEWIAALNAAICTKVRNNSLKPNVSALTHAHSHTHSQIEAIQVDEKAPIVPEPVNANAFKIYRQMTPNDFTFHKVLGKGNYGKVLLATRNDDPSKKYYAVKVIKKTGLVDEESIEHVLSENRVLQTLDHAFLVKLHYAFQTEDRLYFVMEYVRGGELFFHIVKEKRFQEERAKLYVAEILCALQYLHSKDIVYRDLKLENLLIDDKGHIKITDFGLCKEGIGQDDTTSTFCGTPEYLAPEILEEEEYGKSVDWWALGIVMYEMLVGKPPFGSHESVEKLFQAILNQPIVYPALLSSRAKSLLQGLLERDYTKRLGCGANDGEDIMKHPFFEGIDWKALQEKKIDPPFTPIVRDEGDVGNFDKEFTQLPPVLTPTHSVLDNLKNLDLEDFSFVDMDEKSKCPANMPQKKDGMAAR